MIDRIDNQPIRLDRPDRSGKPDEENAPAQEARRADRVEISEEARERALSAADSSLSAERLEEIRQRIDDGTYDTPEVLDAVARAMIERGDV
jgi:anti-sigma28 factor (negative regulator of flagellin synthesis)